MILSIFFLKRSKVGSRSRKHGEIANITNISAVGITFRYLTMMTIGHLLRSLTYPLTSLPGKYHTYSSKGSFFEFGKKIEILITFIISIEIKDPKEL